MAISRQRVSPSVDTFLAAILEDYCSADDAAAAAAFAAALRGESDPVDTAAFAAQFSAKATLEKLPRSPTNFSVRATRHARRKILREYNFNPDEPRNWRGRWTTGGSEAPGVCGTSGSPGGYGDYRDAGPDEDSPGNPKNISRRP